MAKEGCEVWRAVEKVESVQGMNLRVDGSQLLEGPRNKCLVFILIEMGRSACSHFMFKRNTLLGAQDSSSNRKAGQEVMATALPKYHDRWDLMVKMEEGMSSAIPDFNESSFQSPQTLEGLRKGLNVFQGH